MLNNAVVVGRLVKDPEYHETESWKTMAKMILAVTRPYKNVDGEYESDFIECTLWQGIAENTVEYVKKGDLLGVKGRLASFEGEKEGEKYYRSNDFIVERVSFLSTKKQNKEKVEPIHVEQE